MTLADIHAFDTLESLVGLKSDVLDNYPSLKAFIVKIVIILGILFSDPTNKELFGF